MWTNLSVPKSSCGLPFNSDVSANLLIKGLHILQTVADLHAEAEVRSIVTSPTDAGTIRWPPQL